MTIFYYCLLTASLTYIFSFTLGVVYGYKQAIKDMKNQGRIK